MDSNNRLITTAEAAVVLGCTPQTVARLTKAGKLNAAAKMPGIRGAFVFSAEEVERTRVIRELEAMGKASK